ncbi:MAG: DUF3683 domain-containing protein [Ignavibacteriaceae bacterium]
MNNSAEVSPQTGDRFREIPYNYTSFSDKEIILKYFNEEIWQAINRLRNRRVTGRSARLLFEIIGDIFVIERNPYLSEDFLKHKKKLNRLSEVHKKRLGIIRQIAGNNQLSESVINAFEEVSRHFFESFSSARFLRNRIMFSFTGVTSLKNVHFSPFHRILHSTDATDWRVEYPFVVVYPDSISEIPGIIRTAKKLGLPVIPRGGGTGLTAGAVPVKQNTLMINTEKLNNIGPVTTVSENGSSFPVVDVEAGAVTDDVIEHCGERGFVFATDPTSSWASTIGGNIAENAGGKKCVMWGTAIDNLYSYTYVNATNQLIKVKRKNHPYRKILPDDLVEFDIFTVDSKSETFLRSVLLGGTEIRKKGLGKDITNKVLNGLPCLQKEGGDGVIVSAQFVLYKPFAYSRTLCVEFFGTNMSNASKAILAVNSEFKNKPDAFLTALEHFDEKYVTAINYRNKSKRNEIPKAVLLIDVESEENGKLNAACEKILSLIADYNAEGIIARDEKESKLFWNDRKHLGAIARHTNAFKLNEDIVIPLDKLTEFADFIELLNFKKDFSNSLSAVNLIRSYLEEESGKSADEFLKERIAGFSDKAKGLSDLLTRYLSDLEVSNENSLLSQLQEGRTGFSFEKEVVYLYETVFNNYEDLLAGLNSIVAAERSRKIIIATHMHAGDGNVHVNIPVHSNDYLMMQEAEECAGEAMREAARLGGVISGEHGIGLTKLKYIEREVLDQYGEYKKIYDPGNLFNPGKLDSGFPLSRIYTPSFNLLEREAIILKSTELEKLSLAISSCVRCGKCKAVCNTHYPKGNMMYNPRNKILAVGLITEAVLFSAQTLDMKSFKAFKNLRDISDYCTVCHKCQAPCPVKIDFGEVSLTMRKELVHRKKSRIKPFTSVALFYLGRKKYAANKIMRILLLKIGYGGQRIAATLNKPFSRLNVWLPLRINQILKTPFPKSGEPTLRELLGLKNPNSIYCFRNPGLSGAKSVIYFPGCGSERMFPEISIAVIALLYNRGINVIIPPEYLCCGYPFLANGKTEKSELKSYENKMIFHKMAGAAGYMNFSAVIVSCGTCFEMLEKDETEGIFNGIKLTDINEFIVSEGLYREEKRGAAALFYHEPCHTPLKHYGYEKTFESLYSESPVSIPNCCGEAGTLALSRPDITNILSERKSENTLRLKLPANQEILTTCPSCIMGLSKINHKQKVTAKSLAVFNAENFLGKRWKKDFLKKAKAGGVEEILF